MLIKEKGIKGNNGKGCETMVKRVVKWQGQKRIKKEREGGRM
jgi:hypothetical protein